MKLPILILPILLAQVVAGCDLLSFDKDNSPPPGRRDYTWKVDTLYSPPGGFVYDIWGSSPNDVWVVLGGGLETLWHFDGSSWIPWPKRVGGTFYSIYGFARDDVWMGSNDGRIYHFDGIEWHLNFVYKTEDMIHSEINSIWGKSASDIYATGVFAYSGSNPRSFILHYNGKSWRELFVTDFDIQFQRVRIGGGIYITGIDIHSYPDIFFVYRYSNGKLQELLSKTSSEVRSFSLNNVGDRVYINVDNQLMIPGNNGLKNVLTFPDIETIVRVDGRHESDMFIHTWNEVVHHNGQNQYNILESLPRNVFRAQLFSKDAFFVVLDYNEGTNLIYHGTLNEQEE